MEHGGDRSGSRLPFDPLHSIARQHHFAGKWIRHRSWYPSWILHLLRKGCDRYESRIVNDHIVLDGPTGCLKNPMVHYNYRGIEWYFDRHNAYSSMEAIEAYRILSQRNENKK